MRVQTDANLAPMDICACGDYRKQHDTKCWCGCTGFRVHQLAVHIAVEETLRYV